MLCTSKCYLEVSMSLDLEDKYSANASVVHFWKVCRHVPVTYDLPWPARPDTLRCTTTP